MSVENISLKMTKQHIVLLKTVKNSGHKLKCSLQCSKIKPYFSVYFLTDVRKLIRQTECA